MYKFIKLYQKTLIGLFGLFLFLACSGSAQAGFGISPPYVKNNQLVPGSIYEQEINLLRSSAEEDLEAEISIVAPDIESWITIDKGNTFILPSGSLQTPMKVRVEVPAKAEIGNYKGKINVRVRPVGQAQKSGVAIALGARIDIDLTLTNVSYADFIVRSVSVVNIETLGKPWNWSFWSTIFDRLFYNVRVAMSIENIGNVKVAPSKVHIDIYDISEKRLLESGDDTSIKKVDSFSIDGVLAKFPTKLGVGQYWAKIKIYKDETVVNTYKIAFTVASNGTLSGKAPDLGIWPWLVMAGLIITAVIILIILIKIRIWKYIIALLLLIIIKPLSPLGRMLKRLFNNSKKKFWRWISQKAAEQHDNIHNNTRDDQ